MPAALDDLAALDHQDRVGMHDGVQAVRDHDGGAVLAEMLDRFLHLLFGFRIQRRGGFIEQDDRRVLDQRAGHRDALALAAGQLRAVLADRRVVAERKAHDEIVRAGGLRGGDDLGLGGADLAERDVLADGVAEQIDVLADIGGLLPQRFARDLRDRLAVDQDLAVGHFIEPQQQRQHGRFAAAGGADQRGDLAGLGDEAHAVEHGLARRDRRR